MELSWQLYNILERQEFFFRRWYKRDVSSISFTSESNSHSYESYASKAKKAQKKGFNGIIISIIIIIIIIIIIFPQSIYTIYSTYIIDFWQSKKSKLDVFCFYTIRDCVISSSPTLSWL